jgi:putative FmdB family regulatory protein
MPTYEYECEQCGQAIEEFYRNPKDAPQRTLCLNCGLPTSAVRKISAGGGVIFRGSGFYCTDYKEPKGGIGDAPATT